MFWKKECAICQRIRQSDASFTKSAGTRYAGFRFMSQKEILDDKVRQLILRITRWKCNLFSLSSCHEFCKRFTATPYTLYLYTLTNARTSVYDETQAFSIYICAPVYEFAHIYNVFRIAFGSELFESFIRRDSLLTRPGKPDAGEARWNVESHITSAFSMPVSTRLIRKMGNGCDRLYEVAGRKFEF